MPIPGLIPYPRVGEITIAYDLDADNVDLFADVGSPAGAVTVTVYIAAGVTLGAALAPAQTAPNPALDISSSFALGSRVYLVNRGAILGGGGIGGNGDRGRRDIASSNTFVGGGGGGGAGSSSQGGLHAVEPASAATDGAAGTTTTGGAAGVNEASGSGSAAFVMGAAAQLGGTAIRCTNVDLWIENYGTIEAGGDGGEGGYKNGGTGGDNIDPEDGDDLAASVTSVIVEGLEPSAIHIRATSAAASADLTWITGDTYPDVKGYVREVPYA